jgi:hypothetical protein
MGWRLLGGWQLYLVKHRREILRAIRCYTNAYGNCNANVHCYSHADGDSNGYVYSNTNGDTDAYSHT